eukprot:GEMP01010634.1.p1 GENE.GEMP01010634.1~~GEMP01010634.1.p1  ORF type:complete len:522 (-),score=101.26 GEMP01010634.1:1481-3046(-)
MFWWSLVIASAAVTRLSDFQSLLDIRGNYDSLFVIFLAPWCPHSKKALPIFEAVAALHEHDKSMAFAEIDGTDATVMSRVGISEYPELVMFDNTNGTVYLGDFSAKSILTFVESQKVHLLEFTTEDELREWWNRRLEYSGDMNTVVIFHGGWEILPEELNSGSSFRSTFHTLLASSEREDVEIWHGNSPHDVVTLKENDALDTQLLEQFFARHMLPLFQELTPETFEQYTEDDFTKNEGLAAICVPHSMEPPTHEDIRETAMFALKHPVRLVWLNTSAVLYKGCPSDDEATGLSVSLKFASGKLKGKYWTGIESWPAFDGWVKGVIGGSERKFIKSSEASVEESGLHQVSALSLSDILVDDRPALLLVTNIMGGACTKVLRTFAQRAGREVIVGVIDMNLNDAPVEVPSSLRWTENDFLFQPMLWAKPSGSVPVRKLVCWCSEMMILLELLGIDPAFSALQSKLVVKHDPFMDLRAWITGEEGDMELLKGQAAILLDAYAALKSRVETLQTAVMPAVSESK